jgi:BirA family transcriptional regulator, biotin operon repressor / biotin---[acetyl-CoA-carboxylase] ligase
VIYRLLEVELLQPELIRSRLLPNTCAWLKELTVHQEIRSTNAALVARASHDAIDGVVYLAERQTAGRGRRGRTWVSPFGRNIALSVGIGVERPPARLGGLSLAIGLATIDAIKRCSSCDLSLKWPNDVLLGGRKLGGILVEVADARVPVSVVIGVGLNIGIDADERARIDQPIADLAELDPRPSRNALAATLIDSIVDYTQAFAVNGFAPMRELWLERHALQGKAVRIAIANRVEEGSVEGVTVDGALLVRDCTGTREYVSGEVSVRSAG